MVLPTRKQGPQKKAENNFCSKSKHSPKKKVTLFTVTDPLVLPSKATSKNSVTVTASHWVLQRVKTCRINFDHSFKGQRFGQNKFFLQTKKTFAKHIRCYSSKPVYSPTNDKFSSIDKPPLSNLAINHRPQKWRQCTETTVLNVEYFSKKPIWFSPSNTKIWRIPQQSRFTQAIRLVFQTAHRFSSTNSNRHPKTVRITTFTQTKKRNVGPHCLRIKAV